MKKLLFILSISIFLISCTETDILDESGEMEVSNFNIPELPEGYYYQGWLLVDGSFVSVGQITNDSIQNGLARFSEIDVNDLETAQSFAITVEEGSSSAPSNYVFLLGNFDGNTAELAPETVSVNGVLGIVNLISASYTVQNATVPDDQQADFGTNGVWFFKGTDDTKETTLQLNYDGLNYQAWLENTQNNANYYLNMGIIESDTITDSWRNFTQFPNNTPDFAGEDFLQQPSTGYSFPEGFFPLDVRGSKIIITPIPTNYNDTEVPFPIFLLQASIPTDAVQNTDLTREFQINTNFSLTATKK